MGFDPRSLAVDAVSPAEEPMVMMVLWRLRLRLIAGRHLWSGRRVARIIVSEWGRSRNRGNG
jgi:hypothetical protein